MAVVMVSLSILPAQTVKAEQAGEGAAAVRGAFERRNLEFSDKWLYIRGDVSDARYLEYDDSGAKEVTLPHARDHYELYDLDLKDMKRVDWYRRHFTIPGEYSGRRVFVEFEGGGQKNAVYVNGGLVGKANGMYTPFRFDITDYISFGEFDNVIAVQVDSNYYGNEMPPGNSIDFHMTGGLHGDAFMTITDSVYVEAASYYNDEVREGDSSAILHGRVMVVNTGKQAETVTVEAVISDGNGMEQPIASSEVTIGGESSEEVELGGTLLDPRLWSLEDPYLYTVKTRLSTGDQESFDQYEHTLGIRTFGVTPPEAQEAHAYLNGKEIKITGVNKHMQAPYLVNSMPNRLHESDAYTLKYDLGVNYVRTSHYQSDPAFLEACDRIGLLVEEEALGWDDTPGWNQFEYSVLEMVKRDRNHPSIVLWSVLPNERPAGVPSDQTAKELVAKVNALDPSRLTIQEENKDSTPVCDVYGFHDYNTSGNVRKPGRVNSWLVTEWNTNLGKYFVIPGDSEARKLLSLVEESTKLAVFQSDPRLLGSLRWDTFGYLTPNTNGEKGKNVKKYRSSGLYSIWKTPLTKTWLGYSIQAQGNPAIVGDVLKICSEWKEDSPREIWVVSNLDRVGLYYQDGTNEEVEVGIADCISTLPAASGDMVDYKGLVRFTLPEELKWTPESKLTARGYRKESPEAVAKEQTAYASTYEVEKDGARVVLHNVTAEVGTGDTIRADGADMAYLAAEIQDRNGQREYYGAENISARLLGGPGSLWYGKEGMTMVDGVSGFYVKSQHGVSGDTKVEVSVDIGDNYDDSWESVVYQGGWKEVESQDAYHTRIHQVQEAGASAAITFTGTQIALYGQNQVNNGSASITIDGENAGTANFACGSKYEVIANQEVFKSEKLEYGEHTLVITANTAGRINLDRIKVFDGKADIVSEPFTVTSEDCEIEMVVWNPSLPKAEDHSHLSPQEEENLALKAVITVSGTTMGQVSYLNDGKTGGTEYWGGTPVPTTANGTDHAWICYDLGERDHSVNRIVSYYRNNAWPTAYQVAVSDDKTNWQVVEDITYGNAMENNKIETLELSEPVTSRYLALYYTQRNKNASQVNTIMLYETELMGHLKPLSVKEQLQEMIAQAEAVNRDEYEASTVLAMERALEYAYNVIGIADFSEVDGLRALKQLQKAIEALTSKKGTVIRHTDRTDTEGTENKVYYYAKNPAAWASGPDDTYANKNRQEDDYYTITFTGTKIAMYTKKSTAHGYAGIAIDGGEETVIDQYAPSNITDQLFYESEVLPYGKHQVKVRVTAKPSQNPNNACVGFSYAYIFGTDQMEAALDDLREAVAAAEGLDRSAYTLESLEAVDRAWLEAKKLLREEHASIETVSACTERLLESLGSLVETQGQEKADTETLKALVTELSGLDSAVYSESSWREFLYEVQAAVRLYHTFLSGQYPEITVQDSSGITGVLIEAAMEDLAKAKEKLSKIWVWDPSVIPPLAAAGSGQYTVGGSAQTEAYNRAVEALMDLGDSPTQQEAEAALSILEAAKLKADVGKIEALLKEAEAMDSNPSQYTPEVYEKFKEVLDSLTGMMEQPDSLEIDKINGAAALRTAVDALKLDIMPEEVHVTEIIIGQLPFKIRYKMGESFEVDGLMVKARLSDGTELALPEDSYTIYGFDSDSEGEKTLTVSYTKGAETFTVSFTVAVEGERTLEERLEAITKNLKKALKDDGLTSEEKYEAVCGALEEIDTIEFTQSAMTDRVWRLLQELEETVMEQSRGKITTKVGNHSQVASMSNATAKGLALNVPYTKASSSNAVMVLEVSDAAVPEELPFELVNAVAVDFKLNVESDDPDVAEEEIDLTAPIRVIMSIPKGVDPDGLLLLTDDGGIRTIPVKVSDHMEFYLIKPGLLIIGNKPKDEKPNWYDSDDSDDDQEYTGEWMQDAKGWWYEMPNGTYPSREWKQIEKEWYYFDQYGYMVTGWLLQNGRWYYLDPSGKMLKSQWLFDENQWYYFHEDGVMAAGRWVEYKKGWYYLKEDGAMAVSTMIDGEYRVGEDGKWIPAV